MLGRNIKAKFPGGFIPLLAIFFACRAFNVFGEVNNPFDPSSADYVPPQTEFVGGPALDEVLHESQVTLQWRHANPLYRPTDSTGYTVAAAVEFAYRINSGKMSEYKSGRELLRDSLSYWTFDTLTGIHTFNLNGLEDRQYIFTVICRYPTDIDEGSGKFKRFTIDALQGPGLILSPAIINLEDGGRFILTLKVIDVVDLMGVLGSIDYDSSQFLVEDYLYYSDSTDFLMQSMASNLGDFTFIEDENGIFTINIALAAGSGNGVNGSGDIVQLTMKHIGIPGNKTISILPESALRNTSNEDQLILIQNSVINVW